MVATATATVGAIDSDGRGFDAHAGPRRHALVNCNVALVHGSLSAPIVPHHIYPLHVLCVQFAHRFHIMPIPGVRELVHESRTADSSSVLNAGGVFVIAASRAVHPDRAITASIAKTVRFMINPP